MYVHIIQYIRYAPFKKVHTVLYWCVHVCTYQSWVCTNKSDVFSAG